MFPALLLKVFALTVVFVAMHFLEPNLAHPQPKAIEYCY